MGNLRPTPLNRKHRHPTRIVAEILNALRSVGPVTCGRLSEMVDTSSEAVGCHLDELERGGIVRSGTGVDASGKRKALVYSIASAWVGPSA